MHVSACLEELVEIALVRVLADHEARVRVQVGPHHPRNVRVVDGRKDLGFRFEANPEAKFDMIIPKKQANIQMRAHDFYRGGGNVRVVDGSQDLGFRFEANP